MARTDNYLIQAQQAKNCFLTYDAAALAKKLKAKLDADFLYTTLFGQSYRVSRKTGDIQRLENGAWQDGNSYEEIMTLLDLICDSREDRHVSGRWKAMQDFGLQFHQKLLEESPSPALTVEQRQRLFRDAAEAVASIGYTGAGTLEFLLDGAGQLWFMEMNVRLQVEHAVTEMLTQYDLVKWQIRTAAGIPLSFSQADVPLRGAAIECRVCARTPGTLRQLHVPGGPFVRFDTDLVTGCTVSPFYDPLIGKLIVFAATREEALRKLRAALCELVIDGVETNIGEQLALISDARYVSGNYDLTLIGEG